MCEFTLSQKVLFKHCDPAGIVFYPRYFEMINDAIEAFFDEVLGASFVEIHKTGGVPTAQIQTTFNAPSRHGDVLQISLKPKRVGGSSLDVQFQAKSGTEIRFFGISTLVYVNQMGRPIRWPEPWRARMHSSIGE